MCAHSGRSIGAIGLDVAVFFDAISRAPLKFGKRLPKLSRQTFAKLTKYGFYATCHPAQGSAEARRV
jgi:hypothetical protein